MHHIGIDVSKAKLDCLWLRDSASGKVKTKIFKNQPDDFYRLSQWLLDTLKSDISEIHITLEATGIYHEMLAYYLYKQGYHISVVNPARTCEFAKSLGHLHKTDKKDSYMLALFGCRMTPQLWQPEPPEVRELKAMLGHLEALNADLQRQLNRLEKANITQVSAVVIKSLNNQVRQLTDEKAARQQDIDDHIDQHPQLRKDKKLLESIPGIGEVLSRLMLSLLHSRQFCNAGQVAAYVGLIPTMRESGTYRGRTRLSKKGSPKLRAKLYMGAIVASTYNPDILRQKARLLKNGKTKMQALGAAMRKLVQICYGVLKHQCEYQPQFNK